jgi:hypothetical protein
MLPKAFKLAVPLFFAASASADPLPPPPGSDLPDFVLSRIVFEGKSVTLHDFPVGTKAASPATMKLGRGTPVGMQGELCQYQMTFDSVNAGPGDQKENVNLKLHVTFPDGSSWDGTHVWCEGFMTAAGAGCSFGEEGDVTFAVGKTQLTWIFDPDQKVAEFSEANNTFKVDVLVGQGCETASASLKPPSSGVPSESLKGAAAPATAASLKSLQSAFASSPKPIKRPVPARSAKPQRRPVP